MLNADQRAYFDAFGFIVLRTLFSREEMDRIIAASEGLWAGELNAGTDSTRYQTFANFVERSPDLMWLIDDDRPHGVATDLLGERIVWASSEGNMGMADLGDGLPWHADRPGHDELSYPRVKMMLYLDPMSVANGALRVIPGSHRSPLHESLLPFYGSRKMEESRYFGERGADIPCHVVDTEPGDLVVFDHSLFHGVFAEGRPARRYLALKYAAEPRDYLQAARLVRDLGGDLQPQQALVDSDRPRIRSMIEMRVDPRPWHRYGYAMPPEYLEGRPAPLRPPR